MTDYTIFYKDYFNNTADVSKLGPWDIFVSTYSLDERIVKVFDAISANEKYWLIHKEYNFASGEVPSASGFIKVYDPTQREDEADFISNFFGSLRITDKTKLCIDITAFTRPTLIFLMYFLKNSLKLRKFELLYSEPNYYSAQEKTVFAEDVTKVSQIAGYEGKHVPDNLKDVLIIGTGYDHSLITHVAEDKEYAQKIKIFGFPSLKADMYQENILQVQKAVEAIGTHIAPPFAYYAPAYDPFVTASILNEILENLKEEGNYTNIYLCPLGTKAHVLGFALFYLNQCFDAPISIIYPHCSYKNKKDSVGLSGVWKYVIEFN